MGLKIFFCYAHKDKKFLEELKKHLSGLQKEGLIELWCDQDISAGQERELEVTRHLNSADIILLLVSADFIVSNYYSSEEMKHLLERHQLGETRVIPIILRPVSLQYSPLSKLHPLPALERPVSMWPHRDRAFEIITEGIVKVIEEIAPCAFHELYKNIKDSNKERISSQFPRHLLMHLLTEQWNSPPDHLELTDREIHVWKISVQQSSEDIHLLRNLLTPEEIAAQSVCVSKKTNFVLLLVVPP